MAKRPCPARLIAGLTLARGVLTHPFVADDEGKDRIDVVVYFLWAAVLLVLLRFW
jgi:hypothetical protein